MVGSLAVMKDVEKAAQTESQMAENKVAMTAFEKAGEGVVV